MNKKTVAIIGGGPAGVSAAIQLKRYGIDFYLFEKSRIGGLANNANLIENYPGIPRGVDGGKFSSILYHQLKEFKIAPVFEEVKKIEWNEKHENFNLITDKNSCYSEYVIAATGTIPVIPDVVRNFQSKSEERVYFDISDFPGTSGCKVAIIGGGDAAFDYALSLSKKNMVIIINRSKITRPLPFLLERVEENKLIRIVEDNELINIKESADEKLQLVVKRDSDDPKIFECDFLLCAAGRNPNSELFKNISVPGHRLLYAGDIRNGIFRQAVIAAGNGLKCAMKIALSIGDGNR